jgi:hypothetical protein
VVAVEIAADEVDLVGEEAVIVADEEVFPEVVPEVSFAPSPSSVFAKIAFVEALSLNSFIACFGAYFETKSS